MLKFIIFFCSRRSLTRQKIDTTAHLISAGVNNTFYIHLSLGAPQKALLERLSLLL